MDDLGLTEEEAKTKRCQEAFSACDNMGPAEYIAAYASQPSGAPYNCIASSCMAWRWSGGLKGYCGKVGAPK